MLRGAIKTLAIVALLAAGAVALVSEPGRNLRGLPDAALFLGCKLLGVCLVGAAWSLFNRWKGEAIINTLARWIEEER
ncbi:MAG: hypothetical protein LUC33_05065 [Prevotellaceae bacterium]|nr:hypothetical protein [Prevotellaceae bacterium]